MALEELAEELKQAERAALATIAAAAGIAAIERARPVAMGKNSAMRGLLKRLGGLPAAERPQAGQIINQAQARVESAFEAKLAELREAEMARQIETQSVDVTLPGTHAKPGGLHPLTLTLIEIERIFTSMGYEIASGPDVETEHNNFDALNIKPDHPARDMHDTFYLDGGRILRTHTSPVQIRHMLAHKPPLAIIAPGRVYRVDDIDATHSPVFLQVEGLLIDRGVSMAQLKGTLTEFLHAIFGKELATRFRASYFPFTEPSAEVDVQCFVCRGPDPDCRICKGTGWLEVLGSGLVHPDVLRNVGIDPREFSGFAFGMGVERITMLRYGIPSIRLFYENDIRFLRQFA
ncbi:MAG: phenylalanine--tRNA ligase subunit alpha [bacterium]|nr:phenylalanine--tRNA ligase subunit alpha [Candidatus Sumerlaeota bacterium]